MEFSIANASVRDEQSYQENVAQAYATAKAKLNTKPTFAVGAFPYLNELGGAQLVKAFDDASDGFTDLGRCSLRH